jgi:hypothetical protein
MTTCALPELPPAPPAPRPGAPGYDSDPLALTCDKCAAFSERELDRLVDEARARTSCRRHWLGGRPLDLHVLSTPKLIRDSDTSATNFWTGFGSKWLTAIGLDTPRTAPTCASDPRADAVPILLRSFEVAHVHPDKGHGTPTPKLPLMQKRLCAMHRLAARLLASVGGTAVLVLDFGGEWATKDFVFLVERSLASCGMPVERTIFLHYNVGAMLPLERNFALPRDAPYLRHHWAPFMRWARRVGVADGNADGGAGAAAPSPPPPLRLRQAYWNSFDHSVSRLVHDYEADRNYTTRYGLCDERSTMLARRVAARLAAARAGETPMLLLGGGTRTNRFVVLLEAARRGLLNRTRWSFGRYNLCGPRQHEQGGKRAHYTSEQKLFLAGKWRPPHTEILPEKDEAALLGDANALHRLCAELPKVLDVNPDTKTPLTTTRASHEIWADTSFALTFDTAVDDFAGGYRNVAFITEKIMKPLLNLRPVVMLGAPGALAIAESHGFNVTLGTLVDASYDRVLKREARVAAALDEADRLSRLPAAHWLPAAETLVANQRHLYCGGFARELADHARAALELAVALKDGGRACV